MSTPGFRNPKRVEVRSYTLEAYTHTGVHPKIGQRVYLAANGDLYGSCVLGGLIKYSGIRAFNKDRNLHHVTPNTCTERPAFAQLQKMFHEGRVLYGWRLRGFRWFSAGDLPRSGAYW